MSQSATVMSPAENGARARAKARAFLHPEATACAAGCRSRRLCRPLLSGFTGTAVECGETATVPSATHFFCLARKSGQKEALENDLWRLRADSLQRPVRAQDCYFSDSLRFRQMYHTQSRIADIRFWFCSFPEYSTGGPMCTRKG